MKSKVILFIISFGVWLILTWNFDKASVVAGALIAFLVVVLSRNLFEKESPKWLQGRRYLYFLLYLVIFLRECFKANIDVALRVINPRLPINPGIVKVKTRLKSEVALTFLANSITLTPGTITVDIDEEEGFLYIHWINVQERNVARATEIIIRPFEDILEKVFE